MSVMTGMQYREKGRERAKKFKEKMEGIGYSQKTHYFSKAFIAEIEKLSSSMSKTDAIEYVFQGYLKNITRTSLEQKQIKPETTVKIDYDKLKPDTRAKIELITDAVDMTREMLIDMAIELYDSPPIAMNPADENKVAQNDENKVAQNDAMNPEDETPVPGGDSTPPPEKEDIPKEDETPVPEKEITPSEKYPNKQLDLELSNNKIDLIFQNALASMPNEKSLYTPWVKSIIKELVNIGDFTNKNIKEALERHGVKTARGLNEWAIGTIGSYVAEIKKMN